MRLRPAEIDHQAVTEVLSYMTFIARYDFTARALIGLHQCTQVFRIQLLRKLRGADKVTEHDGELPAFGFQLGCRYAWGFRRSRFCVLQSRNCLEQPFSMPKCQPQLFEF